MSSPRSRLRATAARCSRRIKAPRWPARTWPAWRRCSSSCIPTWTPMMIKSALMTTTTQMTGAANTAPFTAGSGLVNPNAAMNPGLVFDSGAGGMAGIRLRHRARSRRRAARRHRWLRSTRPISTSPSIAGVARDRRCPYVVTRRVTNVATRRRPIAPRCRDHRFHRGGLARRPLRSLPGETKSLTVTLTRTDGGALRRVSVRRADAERRHPQRARPDRGQAGPADHHRGDRR